MAYRGTNETATEKPIEGGIRFFARYTDLVGRQLVRKCATRVIEDYDATDYTIFHADGNMTCLNRLKRSPRIINMEVDHPAISLAPPIDLYRNLEEQIPWGIKTIQADLLPPGENDVTIW